MNAFVQNIAFYRKECKQHVTGIHVDLCALRLNKSLNPRNKELKFD